MPSYPLLSGLTPRFRPIAITLLAQLVEARYIVMIVETGPRSLAQHQKNLDTNKSWTQVTKHLDARDRGWPFAGSDAIDLAPYETYELHGPDKVNWDAADPIWLKIGQIGEALGLRWLGRTTRDKGHFEYPGPALNPEGTPDIQLARIRLPEGVKRTFTA